MPASGASTRTFLPLLLVVATYATTQTSLIPALADIERALGVSASGATGLMSAFYVAGAATVGIAGRLGDMFGKKRVLCLQLGCFIAGALCCAVTTSLPLMIGGRVMMGVSAGLWPLTCTILADVVPRERLATRLAILASMLGVGAAVGLALGGVVADQLGYEAVFLIAAGMGVLGLALTLVFVPESPERSGGRVDVPGALLLATGVGLPLIGISQAVAWGWLDVRTIALIAAGALLLWIFVAHLRTARAPLLDLAALREPRLALSSATAALTGFGMLGATILVVQFLQVPESTGFGIGASPSEAGLLLVPCALLMIMISPLAGRLSDAAGPRAALLIGCGLSATGLLYVAAEHTSAGHVVVGAVLLYLGNCFALAGMPALVIRNAPPGRSGEAMGTNMVARLVGSATGAQVAAVCVASSVGSSGLPTDEGFTLAFLVQGIGAALAFTLALTIPAPRVEPGGNIAADVR